MMITSRQNPEIKFLRSLYKKKHRQIEKMFVIEGIRIIEDALADGGQFVKIYYSPLLKKNDRGLKLLERLRTSGVKEFLVEDKLFTEIADTETPQGMIAILKQPDYRLEDLLTNRSPCPHIVMINGVQDPGNLGTILRTAAGAGWAGALLTKGTVDLYNAKSIRATMGALHRLPIYRLDDDWQIISQKLKKVGYQIIATDLKADNLYYEVDFTQPSILIVGNEGHGVDEETIKEADLMVKIPMSPGAESLNVAVAAGILIFEGVRQILLR